MKRVVILILLIFLLASFSYSMTTKEIIDKYVRFDDWSGAKGQLELYLQTNSADSYAYSLYSTVLNELKLYDEAITAIRKAITIETSNEKKGEMFFNLGNYYYNKGLKDIAVEMYKKSSIYNPLIAQPYYMIGIIGYEANDFNSCLSNWKKFVALSTNIEKKEKLQRIIARFEKKLADEKKRKEEEERKKKEYLDKLKKELENNNSSSESMNEFNIKKQESDEDFEEID